MQKIIDSEWRIYSERAIPANATVEIRMEIRRAFYAGMYIFYEGMMNNEHNVSGYLEATAEELNAFRAGILHNKN